MRTETYNKDTERTTSEGKARTYRKVKEATSSGGTKGTYRKHARTHCKGTKAIKSERKFGTRGEAKKLYKVKEHIIK